jgi:hypothetical protein
LPLSLLLPLPLLLPLLLPFAVALAFLAVIPAGDLLLFLPPTALFPNPHPERNGSRFCEPRSRRTCPESMGPAYVLHRHFLHQRKALNHHAKSHLQPQKASNLRPYLNGRLTSRTRLGRTRRRQKQSPKGKTTHLIALTVAPFYFSRFWPRNRMSSPQTT